MVAHGVHNMEMKYKHALWAALQNQEVQECERAKTTQNKLQEVSKVSHVL